MYTPGKGEFENETIMNMADAAILIFWLVCLIRGTFRGPVNELFSIAGVLGGLFAAAFFYPTAFKLLSGWMEFEQQLCLTIFLTLFGGIYMLVAVLGVIAIYLFHLRRAGWMSRAFGAGFGTLKGVLVVAVLLVPLVAFLPINSAWIGESVVLPYADLLSEKIVQTIPAAIHDPFTSHMDGYKQSWNRNGELSTVR